MPDISKPSGINNRWAEGGLKSAPDVSKIDLGWEVEKPPYQVQNWLDNKQDNFNAHVNQHGIPYWDGETEYQASKSYVVDPISGIVYRCLVTNTNQPVNNPVYWDIAFSPYEAMVPTGSTQMFAGTSAPRGWLIADGSAVSRTTYAALFAVIGTTYGNGNGSTTFNLPDMRGVVVRGVDRGRNLDPSRVQGSYQGDLFTSHTHNNTASAAQAGQHLHTITSTSAGSGQHTHTASIADAGDHTHTETYIRRISGNGEIFAGNTRTTSGPSNDPTWTTHSMASSSSGLHSHTATVQSSGQHTHTITSSAAQAGQHSHTITMNNASTGGTETRMKNIAMLGIIKF
jgi:microcystin-dependent protein